MRKKGGPLVVECAMETGGIYTVGTGQAHGDASVISSCLEALTSGVSC